jgi:hypothetical protein
MFTIKGLVVEDARKELQEAFTYRPFGNRIVGAIEKLIDAKILLSRQSMGLRLTNEELTAACKNIGYDLACGACAELFYTGSCFHEHEPECKTVQDRALKSSEKFIVGLQWAVDHLKTRLHMNSMDVPSIIARFEGLIENVKSNPTQELPSSRPR